MQSLREEMAALQAKIFTLEKEILENPDESKRDERKAVRYPEQKVRQ